MGKVVGSSPKDYGRIGAAVRDYESRPPRRPVSTGGHVRTSSRAVVFELISETPDVNGRYPVYIMQMKADGSDFEAASALQAKLKNINS